MDTIRIDLILEQITPMRVLWLGLSCVTILLLGLLSTKWGHSKPLRKCAILSMLCHILLGVYFTTVPISLPEQIQERTLEISRLESLTDDPIDLEQQREPQPWDQFTGRSTRPNVSTEMERQDIQGMMDDIHRKSAPVNEKPSQRLMRREPTQLNASLDVPKRIETEPPKTIEQQSVAFNEQPKAPIPRFQQTQTLPNKVSMEQPSKRALPQTPSVQRSISVPIPSDTQIVSLPTAALPRRSEAVGVPSPEADLLLPLARNVRAHRPLPAMDASDVTPIVSEVASVPFIAEPLAPSQEPIMSKSLVQQKTLTDITPDELKPMERPALPPIYRLRTMPEREQIVERMGGSRRTEAAVEAALKWLANNQSKDGRWVARDFGAGKELQVGGQMREGAGSKSDHGVTGLALLAFLGAGQTHQEGRYQDTVKKAVHYLVSQQAKNGHLAGEATLYSHMYCHAMAAFALSECYAMTHDQQIEPAVRKAVEYTLHAQHPENGSWRYKPGDQGDTSVLGWQLMVLKSAQVAGIKFPAKHHQLIEKYLKSVASGNHGGLASYRPGESPSRTMTAETLVCWHFLGKPLRGENAEEAGEFILNQIPSHQTKNFYYWYYGTLAMYQLQGPMWKKWNDSLTKTLIEGQERQGKLAGSWEPNSVWGGYGGRVYSTATATLSLEVYYRFLPVYSEVISQKKTHSPYIKR